jgi:HEAT repeat protein
MRCFEAGFIGLFMVGVAMPVAAASPSAHAQRMESLGYQRYEGAWRTSQEISLMKQADTFTAGQVAARQQLERLRRDLDKPATAEQAAEQIRGMHDPLAVPALSQAIQAEPLTRARLLYVEALAHIGTADAVGTLLSLALDHPDREVRWQATEQLEQAPSAQVVPPLVAALAGPHNDRINRAAAVLGRVGDRSAIEPLIRALVTTHVVVTDPGTGGQTSATFTPGGGGLTLGGGPKTSTVSAQNRQVLEALTALTEVNYSWDQASWQAWWRGQQLSPETDLRRSP